MAAQAAGIGEDLLFPADRWLLVDTGAALEGSGLYAGGSTDGPPAFSARVKWANIALISFPPWLL